MTESMKEWIKECKELRKENEWLREQIEAKDKELAKYTCTSRHSVMDDYGFVRTCYDVQDCKICIYKK